MISPTVILPLSPTQLSKRFFIQRFISPPILNDLSKSTLPYEKFRILLSDVLELNTKEEELNKIFFDHLYPIYEFAKQKKLSSQKLGCLLEISYEIFTFSFNKRLSHVKSFDYLKDLLVRHSLFRPPHSILIFNLEDIKQITDFFLFNFYQHYTLYSLAFTPKLNMEINTFQMFKSNFPICLDLDGNVKEVDKNRIRILRQYLIDKETGLTEEELEKIKKGDSIHNVPEKLRTEWLRLKEEREKKEKIERVLQKEIEKVYIAFEEKLKIQDEEFMNKVNDFKAGKKK